MQNRLIFVFAYENLKIQLMWYHHVISMYLTIQREKIQKKMSKRHTNKDVIFAWQKLMNDLASLHLTFLLFTYT